MTYRGRVQNGVVVLEGNPPLEEGTLVRVEPFPNTAPPSASRRTASGYSGTWHGEPGELERLLAEVQAMRDADLRLSEDATE